MPQWPIAGDANGPHRQQLSRKQKDIEYVDKFQYHGSHMSRTGDVDTDIHARYASAVFRRLRNVWRCSSICMNTKLHLYISVVLTTAIYAGETWTSVAKTRHMLGVFNRRCLRNILGISWKDHVSNEELFERTKVDNLHDTVDKRRRRFVRLPSVRPVSAAVQWTPEGGKRRRGRHRKT